ncbi:putative Zn peptidase [Dehalogenimonas alkenigignens]|uniref:Putative Zn peptidase n=1 Tax=Dehalogenimonas alkenigignens TaxID=1217799 RepID=A0A0W0GK97_9CHLR|nr:XRE family transcriptional regulator [Dehalogenimonas alkenigignens]KTB49001.1 putative Zn peptidase [Dehalogenimonas alkenigignens]
MTNSAPFNPEMLALARQSRGYTQTELAQLLSVSPGWLSKIEAGLKEVSIEFAQRLAEVLDYPVLFFYKSARICGPGINEVFHRCRSKIPVKARDKNQAWTEINRLNLESLLRGVNLGDIEIPQYDIYEFDGNVRDIARSVRAKWQLPHGPIRNVIKTIEEARGIVIPIKFESRLVDATSRWPANMPPLFFMGLDFPTDRTRFSLCHELGHMVMHQNGPNPYQEEQANEFAAEFLMPEDEIRPFLMDLTLPKLAALKPYWKVSMAALLKRAKDIEAITERHAKTLWIEMGKAGYRTREPVELDLLREEPKLLQEIIGVYCNEMGYSVKELASLFKLKEHEVCRLYFGAPDSSEADEVKAAIEEAERILNEYRHN